MTGRDRIVAIVVAAAVLLAGFWFLALAPKRKQSSELSAQLATQQQRLTAAQASVAQAEKAQGRYEADYAAVAELGQAVPADDDVPSLVYQIDRAADRDRIVFGSLALDSAGSAAPAPPPAPPPPPQAGAEVKDAGSAEASPPAPATQVAASLPPGASVGAAGFPMMPFTFAFEGSFFRLERFLRRLDAFTRVDGDAIDVRGRLLSVDGFEFKAAAAGFPRIAASVRATAYVLPAGQGLTGGATAAGPASTGGGTPPAPAPTSGSAPTAPTAVASLTAGGGR